MGAMVNTAERFGGTLHGFATLSSPEWNQPEIVFEGFRVQLETEALEVLFRDIGSIPSCFDEVEPGVWRFWWDEESRNDPEEY